MVPPSSSEPARAEHKVDVTSVVNSGGPRFVSSALEAELDEVGMVSVPLFGPEVLEVLRAEIDRGDRRDGSNLAIDSTSTDREVMSRTTSVLDEVWAACLGRLFEEWQVVVSTFAVKYPGEGSEMALRREPSFVDERHERSLSLWIPLVDVGPELGNGHLSVVPHSDRLPHGLVGFNTPVLHHPYAEAFHRHAVPVSAPAGTAIVYDGRTLHLSAPNHSASPRAAVACSVVSAGAQLVCVEATGRRGRRLVAVDRSFYVDRHPYDVHANGVGGRVIDEFVERSVITDDDVRSLLGDPEVQAAVCVPADLDPGPTTGRSADPAPSTTRPARAPERFHTSRDLRVMPHELSGADVVPDWLSSADVVGTVRIIGPRLAEVRPPWLGPSPVDGELVVLLEAGSRLRLRFDPRVSERWRVRAIEAPDLGTGILAVDGAGALRIGDEVEVAAGPESVLWHEGPGQFVGVLRPSPVAALGRGRRIAPFGTGGTLRSWVRRARFARRG